MRSNVLKSSLALMEIDRGQILHGADDPPLIATFGNRRKVVRELEVALDDALQSGDDVPPSKSITEQPLHWTNRDLSRCV